MKEGAKRRQNIIQSILNQNEELLKLNNCYVNNNWTDPEITRKTKTKKDSSRQISEKLALNSSQRKNLQDDKECKIENNKHSQVKSKK